MNLALGVLALSVGICVGAAWQTYRIRREADRRATFLRHINELQRVSRP